MTQAQALTILKTGANVFLTGEPGAGKTFVINQCVSHLKACGVEVAITASTGIASTHIGGMTIHSWSGIGVREMLTPQDLDKIASSEYISRRVRRAKVLVIDEISMLGPNTIDMVDMVCKEVRQSTEVFGGLQVVFIGDFFQLPPIEKRKWNEDDQSELFEDEVAPRPRFAYDSNSWKSATPIVCYLTEQHRQEDDIFLSVLSAIRAGSFGGTELGHITTRKIPVEKISKDTLRLFSHNADVDRVNNEMLERISAPKKLFPMTSHGHEILVAILKKGCMSPESLILKVGAQVMCTKNNQKAGYVNGTIGELVGFQNGTQYPIIKTRDEKEIVIEPMDWMVEENGKIKASISQFPLRLAWAITVHKSQGMSLDEAVIDLSSVFEFGQGYVALSRVRRLDGIHLIGWNERAFQVHPEIAEIDEKFKMASEEAEEGFEKLSKEDIEKMHRNFISASGGVMREVADKSEKQEFKKAHTTEITLALWKEGQTLEEIATA
ncbi:MAG: ATP-dependent helicase, partial [Patescibacteria group bacterium]|nr:ATP-dependent helicase [Patescibacteria group bacterium]